MGCRDAYSVVERNGKSVERIPCQRSYLVSGRANTPDPALYKKLFPAMVSQWRNFFHNAEMPFYYVQIAPGSPKGMTSWIGHGSVNVSWS